MWGCLANRALLLVQQLPSSIDVVLRTSSVSCPTVLVHAMKPTLLSYQTVSDTVWYGCLQLVLPWQCRCSQSPPKPVYVDTKNPWEGQACPVRI
jgi:hypothetical protein